jgi:hypothetical protein
MVKRTIQRALLSLTVAALFSWTAFAFNSHSPAKPGAIDHGFSVKEYEDFHHVLHPLEHEALPKGDFKTIRAKAGELVALGEAILKLGVPGGVKEKNRDEFKEWLGKFGDALVKFKADAGAGTDDQLKESYSSVHDSFEMLAGMLPRKRGQTEDKAGVKGCGR